METKHTPGPWHLVMRDTEPHEIHDRETHFDADGARVGDTANGIAYIERYPGMRGAGEANARLMAAAPDLLDALEECAPVLEAAGEFFNGVADALASARTAIARAKGE